MSGIVGMWNLDARPVDKTMLATLSATLAHRGPDGQGLWIDGPVGLACRLFRVTPESASESQPLADASGAVVVFDGRLDNREELLTALKVSRGISADSPDPAFVLAAYDAFGDRFAERLNGDFALGLFDPRRQKLLLARDAVGLRPLYYCRAGATFLFASEIKALLAHPQVRSRPNDDVLAEFLFLRLSPQDIQGETFFQEVYSVLPAHMVILTPEQFLKRRYWDFDPTHRVRLGSFQEYAEAFRHYFMHAVRRRLRSAHPVVVSVSGGLDSSSIFCVAATLRRQDPRRQAPLLGISYTSADQSPSNEEAFLVEIEREYGIAIERVPMGPVGFVKGSRKATWHVESPLLDSKWGITDAFLQIVQRTGARVLLTGHWGDQMLVDQAYLIDLVHHLVWGEVWAHLKELSRWCIDVNPKYFWRLFLRDLVRYHVPYVILPLLRGFKAKLSRYRRNSPWYTEVFQERACRRTFKQTFIKRRFATAHFRSLHQEATSRYHVLCMEWNNKVASMHGLEMAFPFLDRDLISFLMKIPGEMQAWNGVPKAILRGAMRGVLPAPIAERRWKEDSTDLVNEGMERDYPQLMSSLQPGGLAVRLGYVKEEVMREELTRLKNRIRGPDCMVTWNLRDLLGLELWLRAFFADIRRERRIS